MVNHNTDTKICEVLIQDAPTFGAKPNDIYDLELNNIMEGKTYDNETP